MIERPITYNGFTFNKQSDRTLSASPFYWVNVRNVDGYYGDEIRYESHPIAGGDGERSGKPFKAGKQLVLSGEIWAQSLRILRVAEEKLQETFWTETAHNLLHHTWITYEAAGRSDSSGRVYFICKVAQPLVIADTIDGYNYKANWTVGLKADDPRLFKESDNSKYYSWQ